MITLFESVLFYTNKLKILKRFYKNVLDLAITESSDDMFTVKVGDSNVTFKHSEQLSFYHFAINIPGNQFSIMKSWMKNRLTLTRKGGVDQFYSQSFNADSMYFEDPAGNIIKLIGRRHRDLFGKLTSDAFLNISEVSIITSFTQEVGDELQDFGIPLFHSAVIDPGSTNYLGQGDTYIALEEPTKEQIFSNRQPTEPHPLELILHDIGKVILDKEGRIKLSEAKDKVDKPEEDK